MKSAVRLILFVLSIVDSTHFASPPNMPSEPIASRQDASRGSRVASDESEGSSDISLIYEGEKHFRNMHQLTFHGENAEAYFSADGSRLIYQAHVGKGNCDQIYIMDLATRQSKLVSTGKGVTTCSYFQYPEDDAIIYASTHLGGDECPPKPNPTLGYVWVLSPTYDIFRARVDGTHLERLTDSYGYDAEATYAQDGRRIIYTSLASGDLEVWTMNPDGSDKKRLTDRLGYDGGAFFSHDGKKIVWRAYYPETGEEKQRYLDLLADNVIQPMALQIWVMDADGSNKVQVTDNGGANFAPFFFPNDRRIIFASNLENPRGHNFDLYAIDIDGSNFERITYYEGFDSFPMFSPDGKKLVFTSNRNNALPRDTNIFICTWVD